MIGLLGCAPAEPEAPLLPEVEVASDTSTWTAADLPDVWAAATAQGWPAPATVLDVYLDFLAHGDAECPGVGLNLDDSVVLGCTAASGYTFAGISSWFQQDDPDLTYRALHADMRLSTPEGVSLLVGGTTYEMTEGGVRTESYEGTFVWEGDGGPHAGGVSGYATRVYSTDTVTFDGGLGFNGLALEAADLVVSSDGTATGRVALRDPAGGWRDVLYDGAACGRAEEDEVCLDLSVVVAP